VEEMLLREHSKTSKQLRRRKDLLLHQLSVRASEVKKRKAGYKKKLAEQQVH
jgi:hypothetical protein